MEKGISCPTTESQAAQPFGHLGSSDTCYSPARGAASLGVGFIPRILSLRRSEERSPPGEKKATSFPRVSAATSGLTLKGQSWVSCTTLMWSVWPGTWGSVWPGLDHVSWCPSLESKGQGQWRSRGSPKGKSGCLYQKGEWVLGQPNDRIKGAGKRLGISNEVSCSRALSEILWCPLWTQRMEEKGKGLAHGSPKTWAHPALPAR